MTIQSHPASSSGLAATEKGRQLVRASWPRGRGRCRQCTTLMLQFPGAPQTDSRCLAVVGIQNSGWKWQQQRAPAASSGLCGSAGILPRFLLCTNSTPAVSLLEPIKRSHWSIRQRLQAATDALNALRSEQQLATCSRDGWHSRRHASRRGHAAGATGSEAIREGRELAPINCT